MPLCIHCGEEAECVRYVKMRGYLKRGETCDRCGISAADE
jgi:hypothetical protein